MSEESSQTGKRATRLAALAGRLRLHFLGFVRVRSQASVVGLAACLLAWILSSPDWLVFLNWDQATYAGDHATERYGWSTLPWNAHLAVGQIYFLGSRLSLACGGTVIDGYRLVNALCLGLSSAILFNTLTRLFQSKKLLSAALALVWTTSFVELFYVFTLEDNLLYTPAIVALLCHCVIRLTRDTPWSPSDSVVAGLLAALATLCSWQALPYLGAPLWIALVAKGRSLTTRLLDFFTVLESFAVTLVTWDLLFWATSKLRFAVLLRATFSRPSGNFSFYDYDDLFDLKWVLRSVGGIASALIRHDLKFGNDPPLTRWALLAGLLVFATAFVVLLWATYWSFKNKELVPHVLAGLFWVNLVAAGFYRDRYFRVLVRFDFVALVLVLGFAYALTRLKLTERRSLTILLFLLVGLQLSLALSYSARRREEYSSFSSYAVPSQPEAMWYGREKASFYGFFKRLRREHPDACHFVFRIEEFSAGHWNRDIGASLWSELPNHVLLGARPYAVRWRSPPNTVDTLAQARAKGYLNACAWISNDVRDLLVREEIRR